MIVLYRCDPEKNKECRKRMCQKKCTRTKKPEYAVKDQDGEPIIEYLRREGYRPEIDIKK